MHRTADLRPVVVVEGPSDRDLLERLDSRWVVFISGTRNSVVSDIEASLRLGLDRVAGLVDADFDGLRKLIRRKSIPVFTYEEVDLEALLVQSKWFQWTVESFGSPSKLKEGGYRELRRICIEHAAHLGAVRRVNAQKGWGLKFDAVPLGSKVAVQTLALNEPGLHMALSRTVAGTVSPREIADAATRYKGAFRGKDAIEVALVGIRRRYGNSTIRDPNDLVRAMRLAVDRDILLLTPFAELRGFLKLS